MRGSASRGINRGSITFTRPVFPSPAPPGWNHQRFGFPPSFAPRRHRQRTSGAGTGPRARTWNNAYDISRTSDLACSLNACDLASHSAKQGRPRGPVAPCKVVKARLRLTRSYAPQAARRRAATGGGGCSLPIQSGSEWLAANCEILVRLRGLGSGFGCSGLVGCVGEVWLGGGGCPASE